MKRLYTFVLLGLVLWSVQGFAATSPFGEDALTLDQSATAASPVEIKMTPTTPLYDYDSIAKAMETLAEASENYSLLLKKFAADPSKYADEKGDYREFVKQLYEIGKRLGELSEKLNKIAADVRKPETGKTPEAKEPATPKVISGTVKVGTSLNVRTSPWGKVIGSLRNNDKVQIIGKSGDWYKISYNGQTAYVHANYVETSEKKAGTTSVETPAEPAPANNGSGARGGGLSAPPCQPMPSRASSEYGWRTHPTLGTRRFHDGIDLPIGNGTRLNALGNGTVVDVGYESGGGKYIKVRYDNGYESFYCHLQSYSAKKGSRVSAGQEIARSDNTGEWTTGPHLHFALKKNGQSVNPRSAGLPLP